MNKQIIPIVSLIGVDPERCTELYNSGYFSNSTIPKIDVNIKGVKKIFQKTYSKSINDKIFSFQDAKGTLNVFTSGCNITKDTLCWWSRYPVGVYNPLTSKVDFGMGNVGIPVRSVETQNDDGTSTCDIFVIGVSMSYRCSLAYALEKADKKNTEYNWDLSAYLCRSIYRRIFDKECVPAGEWELLRHNGGSREMVDWVEGTNVIVNVPTFNLVHTKQCFISNP